ncbi:hypothetical protein WG68_18135 [Arsukibacterium ikkense]|uniref:Uncharacterized protein n=1 Tax=Arsukibacterium ikkense TaxID=336831 RepID=A0A0M2V2Q5_9GAMM|nr:hypothetical protein [Arsukibacterium ikkense]KKO43930.1 hypothetical protein WG68_18135 [Arsukibacterium ikkense]
MNTLATSTPSLSWLTGELHSGWTSSAYAGQGIVAAQVPATGENGPSLLYADALQHPGSELRYELSQPPAHGSLTLFEDGSFIYQGNGSLDGVSYQLFIDGVANGSRSKTFLPYQP